MGLTPVSQFSYGLNLYNMAMVRPTQRKVTLIPKHTNLLRSQIGVIGLLLLLLNGTITLFSPYVAYDAFPALIPVVIFVYLSGLSGLLIFLLPNTITALHLDTKNEVYFLGFIILVGFMLRIMIFGSAPILEDDWFRYLWEGALGNAGISPYTYSPADGFNLGDFGQALDPSLDANINELRELSANNDDFAYEVTYPYLTTVYPAGAQAGFRLANFISPFDLNAWRLVLFAAEATSLILVLKVLSLWGRSKLWASLYWWNPIVILEGLNSAHMDLLLVPPILASVIALKLYRPGLCGVFLGLAASVKLWPLLLTPLYIRPIIERDLSLANIRARLPMIAKFLLCTTLVSAVLLYPIVLPYFDTNSGLGAYAGEWRKNNLLFSLLALLFSQFSDQADNLTRLSVASITIGLTLYLSLKLRSVDKLPLAIVVVILTLFLAAPAGYPWYSIWFLPFIILIPLRGALLLCATLPLYYLRFPLSGMDLDWAFNYIIAPIEFGIPLLLLIFEYFNKQSLTRHAHNTA